MSQVAPGVCRYCHCTEQHPCKVPPYGDDDTCGWMPGTMRTVCTAPSCIRARDRDQKAAREAARATAPRKLYSGWGYGAIVADLRQRQRRERRRRGRA